MKNPTFFFVAIAMAAMSAFGGASVKYRGIFINDEDYGLRAWAKKNYGKEGIGVRALTQVFDLMKADGLNLLWPAMHGGGYEFSTRPENFELAKRYGIAIGTSHCEPMLRNNCYLKGDDKNKWSWLKHRDFLEDYWREGARRGLASGGDILWTIGMRGIHDHGLPDGETMEEKMAVMEDVFKFQTSLLPPDAPKLFIPYKEVLPVFNAGLKVPKGTTIMWTNDNFGYIRRLGGPQCEGYGGGIYWHLSYHGYPHGCEHINPLPPAFMWYELVQKCWNNGIRDVWMVNAGDMFEAELLLYCYGKFASDPDYWATRPDPQSEVLGMWVKDELEVGSEELGVRIVAHLNEYFTLVFNRRPEHMCVQWAKALPPENKAELLARYYALLAEDLAIENELASLRASASLRDKYFRTVGYQVRFFANAGIIFLEGKDKTYAESVIRPLDERWNTMDGGKWAGFFRDTIEPRNLKYNKWPNEMMWSWCEPTGDSLYHKVKRRDYPATAYEANVPEPQWLAPISNTPANGGAWTRVPGLGTSGNALALLPVKPGVGEGASLNYELGIMNDKLDNCKLTDGNSSFIIHNSSLILQFLPDFELWPGLGLGVDVQFDDGEKVYVEVPKHDSNIGEQDVVRNKAVQDNFIRVAVPIPENAKKVRIIACNPGVVIDRVGVANAKYFPAESQPRWSKPAETKAVVPSELPSAAVMPRLEEPVACWTNKAGRVVWDFGRDAFGNIEATGDGEIWLGEKLTEDGDAIDRNPPGSVRAAQWPLEPDKRNTGKHAVKLPPELGVVIPFRYVETEPGVTVKRVMVARPMDMASSSFRCSDERLNKVYDFCKYTILATSFAGLYVDGDRERIPYEADAYINMLGEQAVWADSEMAKASLVYLLNHPTWPTEWQLIMPIMAHGYYMATGDSETIRACYSRLRELLLLDKAREKDGLLDTHRKQGQPRTSGSDIVDWPSCERDGYEMKHVNTVVNAFHIKSLRDMSELAAAIGEADDAANFKREAEAKTVAFRKVFTDPETHIVLDGEGSKHSSLHANAAALAYGLVEPGTDKIVSDYCKTRGMACSAYFAQYLLEGLFRAGEAEYALELMTREDDRSWLGMMKAGATMCMESWNQEVKPNQDWGHAWSTAPLNIISRFVLGVTLLEPGAKKVRIAPNLCGMEFIEGKVPLATGSVIVKATRDGLIVETPVPASVVWRGETREIKAGRFEFK